MSRKPLKKTSASETQRMRPPAPDHYYGTTKAGTDGLDVHVYDVDSLLGQGWTLAGESSALVNEATTEDTHNE